MRVRDLRVDTREGVPVIEHLDLDVPAGRVLGLVGESGSGKTTAGLAMLAHTRGGLRIAAGSVVLDGTDLARLSETELRQWRGARVSYVPQDPTTALNPALRVGHQVREVLDHHESGIAVAERWRRVQAAFEEVGLPTDEKFMRRYPHELSGGQQQRIGIAMAFVTWPALVVLDEPTTGLDVSTQSLVLKTVRQLTDRHGCAAIYISHDLAVVVEVADEIAVLYAGAVVEQGPAAELVGRPRHPYTSRLIAAVPDLDGRRELKGIAGAAPSPDTRPDGCRFAPRCELAIDDCTRELPPFQDVGQGHSARCIRAGDVRPAEVRDRMTQAADETPEPLLVVEGLDAGYGPTHVLRDLSLVIPGGSCVALLGESGSGKTTLARTLAGLHHQAAGTLRFSGEDLPFGSHARSRAVRAAISYVFQNPYSSLNPRRTVGDSIARPLRVLRGVDRTTARRRAAEMLERVYLSADYADRYPDQLSGGERQRVAVARALISEPALLVCDEITSALDVSVQANIVELIDEMRHELGLTLLFVTHDIALVRNVAQQVAVLQGGAIVEDAPTERLFTDPAHTYTREMLDRTPTLAS
ncbi:MAG: dipeptide ABC transporter ATP-binding protein [Propionibacteriales bacterium]|nr:dipeptide ABC transporter ATP-binding protein [Propionibacteriales bacterium]